MKTNSILQFIFTLITIARQKFTLGLGLMVCLSLMEVLSLLMLIPLLQLVGLDVQQGGLGRIAEFVSSIFGTIGMQPTLIAVLGLYILIVVIHSLLRRWENSLSLTLQYEFVVTLRQRLYRAIANTNWLFLSATELLISPMH